DAWSALRGPPPRPVCVLPQRSAARAGSAYRLGRRSSGALSLDQL
ncbi:MAG: hypothetical protein AVDCRST_MAG88-1696, partial [uncultured Thermomicrobiales bacterium]